VSESESELQKDWIDCEKALPIGRRHSPSRTARATAHWARYFEGRLDGPWQNWGGNKRRFYSLSDLIRDLRRTSVRE
jgi:hypothetical protein